MKRTIASSHNLSAQQNIEPDYTGGENNSISDADMRRRCNVLRIDENNFIRADHRLFDSAPLTLPLNKTEKLAVHREPTELLPAKELAKECKRIEEALPFSIFARNKTQQPRDVGNESNFAIILSSKSESSALFSNFVFSPVAVVRDNVSEFFSIITFMMLSDNRDDESDIINNDPQDAIDASDRFCSAP